MTALRKTLSRLQGASGPAPRPTAPRADLPATPTNAPASAAPVSSDATPAAAVRVPAAANTEVSPRLRARAELAAVYATILGQDARIRDFIEVLRSAPHQDAVSACHHVLGKVGLAVKERRLPHPDPTVWPALAEMRGGQVVLVLAQTATEIVIYERGATDNCIHVQIDEFAPHFGGRVLVAGASVDKLGATHAPQTSAEHWFWGSFPKFRRQIGEVALGSFFANLLAVAVALFSLQVYDRVIPHQSQATLWVLALGAFLALVFEGLLKIARARLTDGAGRQIELEVQGVLMNRLLGMRSDLRGRAPSQLFAAMREFGSVREFFTATTVGTLADIPFILLFLALVASIAGNVVWVLILGGILMVVPGLFLQNRMMRLTKETQGASAKSGRLLQETVFELDTIKSERGEERVRRLWRDLITLSAIKTSEQRRLAAALTFWSQGVQQATYVSAVIVGTYLVFAGDFTVGTIIAVGILTSRTLAPLTQLAGTMARWGNVKAALDGLDAIAEAPQDTEPSRSYLRRDSLEGPFDLREVVFRYDEDGPATLDIPAVTIQPGQRVAVLGANGSGKSTLLRLLSGLYAPSSGRILIDGTEMGQIAPRDLRRTIGYLGQDVRLLSGTLRDNLNLNMLETDDERLFQALDFAGLGQFVKAHHKGLDLEIRDGGAGLSNGQRQSIGWARLWLLNPQVCLLDEPTSALDQTLEKTLVSRLEKWLQGRTVVVATHRVPIMSLTTRTLILQSGRIAVDGPRDAVLAHLAQVGGKAKGG